MSSMLSVIVATARNVLRPRADLLLENAALRQQLEVLRRHVKRPQLRRADRVFWIWLSRRWPEWRSALVIVRPETVLRWHREGYRRYWRWKSKGRPGRPRIPRRHIEFIRRISSENPSWGEDRIALEMKLKLGVEHSTSTIRRYMVDTGAPNGTTWKRFLASHANGILAIDFTTHPLWDFSVRYVFVVLALDTRRIVHVAVTASPTLAWVKQQLLEATAWESAPRFLLHDNDGVFGQYRCRSAESGSEKTYRCAPDQWLHTVLGVTGIPTPYGAPDAAAYVERVIGSSRRECLVHFVFLSERHLRRTVTEYVSWYNTARVHQGIHDIPDVVAGRLPARCPPPVDTGRLVGHPVLGGLTYDYELAA